MSKLEKPFRFTYTVEETRTVNLRRQKVPIAEFDVHAIAYFNTDLDILDDDDHYDVDIEFVYYQGTDLKDILDAFCDLYRIEEKALLLAPSLFETIKTEPYFDLDEERWVSTSKETITALS